MTGSERETAGGDGQASARRRFVLASGNPHKLEELTRILAPAGIDVTVASALGPMPDIVEDGDTFLANAEIKARAVAERFGLPTIADDSGLDVAALDGAPGIRSARYAGDDATDADNNRRLLAALEGIDDRRARFVCVIAVVDGGELLASFTGECPGRIDLRERGDGGFGYDPLFIPDDYDRSFAELGPDIKDRISHRARALAGLEAWVRRLGW